MLHPITVRPTDAGYEVIAGRNRVNAAAVLGWTSIDANVQEVNDQAANTIRLAENVQRSNLTPVEEARQLYTIVSDHPDGVEGAARDLGRPVNWVLDRLDLLEYPDLLLKHIHNKKISLAAAKRLAQIQPPDLRDVRIEQAAHFSINAATAALWLQQALASATPDFELPENPLPATIAQVETVTTVICIRCQNRVDIRQAVPTQICGTCYGEMQNPQPANQA